jgi:hypothetical protein
VRHRSRLKHCRRRLKHVPRPLSKPRGQPLQERLCSYRASGARLAGPLTRPHGKRSQDQEGRTSYRWFQHLWEPQWQTRRCSGATVGDSPRGPLKQLGNPHLKPSTKPKPNTPHLTMQDTAHATEAPTAQRGGPLDDPLEQASPRSRARAPPSGRAPPCSRGCAYLEQASPRSRVRSALEWGPPRSRALRVRAPAPVRGHLMP